MATTDLDGASPDALLWQALAARIGRAYRDAELRLIRLIATSLARDMGAPQWAVIRLAEIETIRRHANHILISAEDEITRLVEQTLNAAADAGQAAAIRNLDTAGLPITPPPALQAAVAVMAADTMTYLTGIRPIALRSVADGYQAIIEKATQAVVLGAQARRDATQDALTAFARHGVTGFTDRAGRAWSMDAYGEMATRTGAMAAMTAGQTSTLLSLGQRFVRVDHHGYTCPKCGPWEGKILSLDGTPAGTVYTTSTVSDELVAVPVAGTVDEARAAGLWHPNCAHTMTAYLPGVRTPRHTARPTPAGGYEATQRQRAIERHIRHHKRVEAAAITPEAAHDARVKVRAWQKARRDLLAQYPDLRAKPVREQIKTAH